MSRTRRSVITSLRRHAHPGRPPLQPTNGLTARYFPGITFSGTPRTRTGFGEPNVGRELISVRWTGKVTPRRDARSAAGDGEDTLFLRVTLRDRGAERDGLTAAHSGLLATQVRLMVACADCIWPSAS